MSASIIEKLSKNNIIFLLLLLFCLPSGITIDNLGIPLNSFSKIAVVLVLLFSLILNILISEKVVFENNRFLSKFLRYLDGLLFKIPFKKKFFIGIVSILFLLKVIPLSINLKNIDNGNFKYCYKQDSSNQCLYHMDNFFRMGESSFYRSHLNWSMNDVNWLKQDLKYLEKMDDTKVEIEAVLERNQNESIVLNYTGDISIVLNDKSLELNSTTPKDVQIDLKDVKSPIYLKIIMGVNNINSIEMKSDFNFFKESHLFLTLLKVFNWLFWLLFLPFLILNLLRTISYLFSRRSDLVLLFGVPISCFIVNSVYHFLSLFTPYFFYILFNRLKIRQNYFLWIITLFITSYFLFFKEFKTLNLVLLGSDDSFYYITFARSIIKNFSLQAGEDIFYYPSCIRYLIPIQFLLFGESTIFAYFLKVSSFITVIFFSLFVIEKKFTLTIFARIPLFIIIALIPLSFIEFIMIDRTEIVPWIFIPLALIFSSKCFYRNDKGLFSISKDKPLKYLYIPLILFSISGFVRPNLWPSIFFLTAVFIYLFNMEIKKNGVLRTTLISSFLFIPLLIFPMIHNIYYGNKFIPFATSSEETTIIPVKSLFSIFQEEETFLRLKSQIGYLFSIQKLIGPKLFLSSKGVDEFKNQKNSGLYKINDEFYTILFRENDKIEKIKLLDLPEKKVLDSLIFDNSVHYISSNHCNIITSLGGHPLCYEIEFYCTKLVSYLLNSLWIFAFIALIVMLKNKGSRIAVFTLFLWTSFFGVFIFFISSNYYPRQLLLPFFILATSSAMILSYYRFRPYSFFLKETVPLNSKS